MHIDSRWEEVFAAREGIGATFATEWMPSCEAFPLCGERSKHGGQIAQSVATSGPLHPENDPRQGQANRRKHQAPISCSAGSMHNESATLILVDALEACWEIKKGSEAIRPAA
jgi:hypothetical protein